MIRVNIDCPPLASALREDGTIPGYEPAAIELVAERMGREVEWVIRPWAQMVPTLQAGDGDVIWCGQGVTEDRSRLVDFTYPYAIFDETVLVRAGAAIRTAEGLEGRRVAAIANSTDMALAETFPGAELVAFDGSGDDVFGDMLAALRAGEVDAVVDDDVVPCRWTATRPSRLPLRFGRATGGRSESPRTVRSCATRSMPLSGGSSRTAASPRSGRRGSPTSLFPMA